MNHLFSPETKFSLARRKSISVGAVLAILVIVQLAPVALSFFIDERQSPSVQHWNYEEQTSWRQTHRQCGARAQSPIDIQRRYVIPNNELKLHFYNYNQLTKFKIQNAHHTIKLNPIDSMLQQQHDQFGLKLQPTGDSEIFNTSMPDVLTATNEDNDGEPEFEVRPAAGNGQSRVIVHHQSGPQNENANNQLGTGNEQATNEAPPYNGAPTIKLDWLDDGNNEYKLRDIHFHWGERRDNGSEHAIDGRRAAMEMHLVHIKHGLDKSKIGYTTDSVAVIAVLIDSYRKSNADFNPIVSALGRINMTNQEQEIEYKSINDLLPNVLTSFYTYSGSLTTPPCYQVVDWIVMSERLNLNAKQIEMFRNLYAPVSGNEHSGDQQSASNHAEPHSVGAGSNSAVPIMPNVRHIQPLNNRTIMASFSPLSRLEQIQVDSSPFQPFGSGANSPTHFIHGVYIWITVAISFYLMNPDSTRLLSPWLIT